MKKRNVHIFQPNHGTRGDFGMQYWLPYSAGCLWAYAQQFDDINENWQLCKLHYKRREIHLVLEDMEDPALCAFSSYSWNAQYNLAMASAIKEKWPNCVIVFGGPQSSSEYLNHEFIESIVYSEGEVSFVEILRRIQTGQPLDMLMRSPRIENLDFPSPYILGLFDHVIASEPASTLWEATIETSRGCPYACTYCDWGGLTFSKVRKFGLERIEAELDWISKNPVVVVMLTDANFGIFKARDMEIARIMRKYFDRSRVEYINMTFLKNSNETIFEIAKEIGPTSKGVTIAIQSFNPATLKAIKRDNMKSNDVAHMMKLSREHNVATYTDMILGLPEETLETWISGMMQLLELGNEGFIDTNFTNILVNTELNQKQRHTYGLKTVVVDYYQSDPGDDISQIQEQVELVSSTNTMTLSDMVEGWMWQWLLQFFHSSGYSHVVSRFLRHVKDVPYRHFYDTLIELARSDSGAIGAEYHRVHESATRLLTAGNMGDQFGKVYNFYQSSYTVFYENIDRVFDMVEQTYRHHGGINEDIMTLQKHCVHHANWPIDVILDSSYDLDSWENRPTKYRVEPRIKHFTGSYDDFARNRRNVLWKNRLVAVER